MQDDLLPLFPLQIVLFPRTALPLHIFEDRYQEMIGELLKTKGEFGVVQAGEKGIMSTGCTASVERILREYPDGRMDILTFGRRRFEIQQLNNEKSYLRGTVEFFDDDDPSVPPKDLQEKALDGFSRVKDIDDVHVFGTPEIGDP